MSHRIITIDLDLTVLPFQQRPVEAAYGQLWLVHTGDNEVDGSVRSYYAAHPPLRLLVVLRNGLDVHSLRRDCYVKALLGWDEGDNPYILPGQQGKRHTKLTIDLVTDVLPDPPPPVITLSSIVAQAPRADRPGGFRGGAVGRPRLAQDDPTEAHNVTLPSSLWRSVERLGDGNHSAGIRRLFELAGAGRSKQETTPMPLTMLKVGEPYSLTRTIWEETADYNYRSGQHELRIFMRNPSPQEIADITRGQVRFALADTYIDVLFLCYKFGEQPWSDATFSIHLVPENERTVPELPHRTEDRALLGVILVDAATGIVRGLRAVSFSHEFTRELHKAISRQAERPFPGVDAYDAMIARIYSGYDSKTIATKLATLTCRGGE